MLNRKAITVILLVVFLVGSTLAAQAAPAAKTDPVGPVEVSTAVQSDVSAPVSSLVGLAPAPDTAKEKKEKPLRTLPNMGNTLNQDDAAVQTAASPLVSATNGLNFEGVGDTSNTPSNPCNCAPPDTNGAVGATQYVQWVNTAFAVYNKSTGAIVAGFPKAGNALWSGFGGACETNNDGDPIVQYDKVAQRWVMTQFAVTAAPYTQCIAVSTTSDATGTYNRYAFSYGTQFNDYPKLGVWPDGYYISYNIFNNGQTFAGSKVCAFDRTKMLAGAAANQVTQQCFQLSTSFGGLLPSDLDGTTAPPAGSPNFFMNFGVNSLNFWRFHVDFTTPANSTFTGPTSIAVAAFNAACSGGGTCIPQPGTNNKLDSLADRLMYRLAYRNFTGTGAHEDLVVNQSVTVGSKRTGITSVRWYELRNPAGSTMAAGTPIVFQQGTLGTSDSVHRWMGSIAMDKLGNIALGYSASSGTIFPSIRYTGRVPADALGTMQAENSILAGTASQTGTLHRWGDYSAMTVDPVDDCTFWFTSEYIKTSGSFNWNTRIASFKLPGC